MAYLSDYLGNRTALQGKAGAFAINSHDLIELNQAGALQSVGISDYSAVANAGSNIVAKTTVAAVKNSGFLQISAPSQSSLVALNLVVVGNTIYGYDYLGNYQGSVVFDSSGLVINAYPVMAELSNGNVVVVWSTVTTYAINFAIINQNLQIVVAETQIDTTGANPLASQSVTALSGGGFAVAYTKATVGLRFAIYSNTGTTVYAPATIAGSATQGSGTSKGGYTAVAQLSNGNIAVAISESYVTSTTAELAFAIFSTTGTVVVGYTVIVGTLTTVAASNPMIAIVNGFFCITAQYLYTAVISNAGVVQGSPLLNSSTGAGSGGLVAANGSNFFYGSGADLLTFSTAGTYTTTVLLTAIFGQNNLAGGPAFAVVGNNKLLVTNSVSNVYVVNISNPATPYLEATTAIPASSLSAINQIVATPSSSVLIMASDASNISIQVLKVENTAIMGIAQNSIAAGNSGSLVTYSNVGDFSCNAVAGSFNKTFDHSATNLIGNKGIMLGNSVYIVGVV